MSTEIKAEVKSLKKIFTDDEIFYQIPDYQRPYSWDDDNISDLLDDLVNAYENNKEEKYFCGSLVLIKNDNDKRYDVVDGQQRLTTFTILFCVLRDFHGDILTDKSKDFINLSIKDKYKEENKKIKFLTYEGYQNDFLQTVLDKIELEDNKKPRGDNKYLLNAYYWKYLIKNKIGLNLREFVEWLFEAVVMTTIVCPTQDTAIQIFNVLNDRGMPLSSVDILKSNLMYNLSDEDKNSFKSDWNNTKKMLEDEGLSFYELFTVYLYYTITSNPKLTLHKELLGQFKEKDSLKLISDIKEFAENYICVLKSEDKCIYCLKYLRHQIYWTTILTTAQHLGYKDFDNLKELIVSYYYINWIAGATIARIKQTSFNIIKMVKEGEPLDDIKKEINENLKHYNTQKSYNEEINSDYVYGKKWDKPVLFMLEYFSQDNSNQSFIPLNRKTHIEHILPQNKEENNGWNGIFNYDEREQYTNCLGNLTLLSMRKNIQAQDSDFENKKDVYLNQDNVSTSFNITQKIFLNNKEWGVKEIEDRKKSLVNKLNKILNVNVSNP